MTDEDLRLLCASTVAAGQGSPVLIDLCASALDLLTRYYELQAEVQQLRGQTSWELPPNPVQQFRDTELPVLDVKDPIPPRKKLTKAQKKAKRNAYQRQYLARKRQEKKAQLQAIADAIQAQTEEQQHDTGANSGAAPTPSH